MQTETERARGSCPFCGTEMSVRGLGSHKANCKDNPGRGVTIDGVIPERDGKLRERVQRQAETKLVEARRYLEEAERALCADGRDTDRALDRIHDAQKALDARDSFVALLAPELKGRNGKR